MSARGDTALAADAPARPAPDEVSEALHPALTPFLAGHEEAEALLAKALADGNMHHAWMITGPPGIGKATLAYRLARKLLEGGNAGPGLFGDTPEGLETDPEGPTFAQVASGSHPNLLRLTRQWNFTTKKYRTEIRVDDVRQLAAFLGQKAERRGRRVVLIDAADDMNRNAANALLKPLEEPPADTVFILVTHRPGGLLPTIRSRCRTIDLRPPGQEAAMRVLERLAPEIEGAHAARLLALADQSPGTAIRLDQQGALELHRELVKLFSALPRAPRPVVDAITRGVDRRGDEAERRFHLIFDLIEGIVQRMIGSAVAGGQRLPEALADEGEFARRLTAGSLEQWFDLCDNLRRLRDRTDTVNLNQKAVTLTLISALESAARAAVT